MRAPISLTVLLTLAAIGCGSDDGPKPTARTVDPTSAAIHAAVQSNASVALKLHSALRAQPGNLFYSPLSIEAVLGMLYAGADGQTAAQIGKVLDVGDDPHALHEGLGALLADLAGNGKDRPYTLSLANRLWATPGLDSSPDFIATTRDLYDAPIQPANFADPDAVRREINTWVDEQTQGKIPQLLAAGQITQNTVMAVVNAIYFKAEWANAFDPSMTHSAMFHRADQTDVPVQMMSTLKTKLRTGSIENARWIELPYRGDDISFIACAPETDREPPASPPRLGMSAPQPNVDELEAKLADIDLSEVVSMLGEDEQIVQMPRFSLHSRLDLIPIFKSLGVLDLFDPLLADLTKIDTNLDLYVDPFLHEATVEVDEHGTVAAADTAAAVQTRSATFPIVLDHPFLFFIRDNLTGAILFTGRVADPTAK